MTKKTNKTENNVANLSLFPEQQESDAGKKTSPSKSKTGTDKKTTSSKSKAEPTKKTAMLLKQ